MFGGAAGIVVAMPALAQLSASPRGTSVRAFGALPQPGRDNTRAIQQAIDALAAGGGGVLDIDGAFECRVLTISGDNLTLRGINGSLINARVVVPEGRVNCRLEDLTIIDRRGNAESYALDVSGRDCTFTNRALIKDPIAGGYQMYLRQPSSNCHFTGLRLKGSNGIMVAGHDHLFEKFELESTMSQRVGGDDAFAIKALGQSTYNVTIRDGTVHGYFAIVSFGSEIGTQGRTSSHEVAVRNVTVRNVAGDRCGAIAFFKPGALVYDWRNGVVWWIQSVYVIPEFRRRGVYAGLYQHEKAMVEAEPSIRGIRLYVDNRNKPAQEVYARLGMEGEHYRVFEWMKA